MANADFTVADVLAWARTKPADGSYSYFDVTNCAMCQFLRDTGRAVAPSVGGREWKDGREKAYRNFPDALAPAIAGSPFTFGGLVKRLEALCPETPVTKSDWLAIDAYLTDIEQVSA